MVVGQDHRDEVEAWNATERAEKLMDEMFYLSSFVSRLSADSDL